ncbi:MAG: hypothetical protein HOW73_04620 [Polyangiaceae bacterium]|nr:hypothetical protein [Polyangiaceae bacterium]
MTSVRYAAALALLTASCAQSSAPCSPVEAGADCPESDACIVGRCRPPSENVVSVGSRRVVLLARDVVVLSSREVPKDARVTAFGSNASGDIVVLLGFDADVTNDIVVDGAFLVVDPEPSAPGPTAPIDIDVAPILTNWSKENVSWARTPSLGLSIGAARVPPARRTPLRIDVTALVAEQRGVGHGLALMAGGADPVGARLVTLARSSNGPKLELYLSRPEVEDAAPKAKAGG